ncbi:MAG: hypothetical protein H9901_02550 [Candidatus Paralactobacillus gallistercoris]|uniref:Pur operon repressor n=1 Tax=Candidatus Paralactobacillus gallistercoris TaxID=2838724 RepID=A0A948TJ21_9LACO|nr:hypothetical protein [Candidatus Paralactobacillus gallistercoris]
MLNLRRNERLIDMMQYLLMHPHMRIPLAFFTQRYQTAKSTISEDLLLIKKTLQKGASGYLITIAGASGGACYIPMVTLAELQNNLPKIAQYLSTSQRIFNNRYIITNINYNNALLQYLSRIIATQYHQQNVDAILTVSGDGTNLAQCVATLLNVPCVIATPTLSEVSLGIANLHIPYDALQSGMHVLVIDTAIRSGRQLQRLLALLTATSTQCVGVTTLFDVLDVPTVFEQPYSALFTMTLTQHAHFDYQQYLLKYRHIFA